jgi:hypothetical protein
MHREVRGQESVGLGFLSQDFVRSGAKSLPLAYFTESRSTFQ